MNRSSYIFFFKNHKNKSVVKQGIYLVLVQYLEVGLCNKLYRKDQSSELKQDLIPMQKDNFLDAISMF